MPVPSWARVEDSSEKLCGRSRGDAQGPCASSNENQSLGWVFQEVINGEGRQIPIRAYAVGLFFCRTIKEMIRQWRTQQRKTERKRTPPRCVVISHLYKTGKADRNKRTPTLQLSSSLITLVSLGRGQRASSRSAVGSRSVRIRMRFTRHAKATPSNASAPHAVAGYPDMSRFRLYESMI